MPYCPKCGAQNTDDSRYCKNCGAAMSGERRDWDKQAEKECEDTCSGHGRSGSTLWGILVILFGAWIITTFVISQIEGLPKWVYDFNFWWVFALIIGALFIYIGIKTIIKR